MAQASPTVQSLPSLQVAASARATLLQAPLSQLSAVQALSSLHCVTSVQPQLGVPRQLPATQPSALVQSLPSLQVAALARKTQLPEPLSQLSSVHGLPSLQVVAVPALQVPSLQTSPLVQASPSLHTAVLLLCEQPFAMSHRSSVHGLPSSQGLAVPSPQVPALQVSPTVQPLPSSHGVGSIAALTQPFVLSQLSAVHVLPSSQFLAGPPAQAPAAQASAVVQASPSSQAATLLVCVQAAPAASQPSSVQGFLSSQAAGSQAGPVSNAVSAASAAATSAASVCATSTPTSAVTSLPLVSVASPITASVPSPGTSVTPGPAATVSWPQPVVHSSSALSKRKELFQRLRVVVVVRHWPIVAAACCPPMLPPCLPELVSLPAATDVLSTGRRPLISLRFHSKMPVPLKIAGA